MIRWYLSRQTVRLRHKVILGRSPFIMFRTTLICLAVLCPSIVMGQKKEVSQARTYIKSKKNLDKAEQLMTGLLNDSANLNNKRIYLVWLEAVKGQYDQANERFYLKQKQDTIAFFSLTKRMFTIAERLDSIDVLPDKKGRVNPEYRQKHATMLNTYRPNLFNGGTYYIRKSAWKEAYSFMEAYMNCARQPLFENYNYASTDQRMSEAAYWTTYSGYMMHDAELTLRYHQQALLDTLHTDFTLQFVAEARLWQGDNQQYIATLQKGFHKNPLFPYFFPRLMDAYTAAKRYEDALNLADSALAVSDSSQLFLYAKSATLLRMQRWEESITYSKKIMQLNDSIPEPYYNAGTAYIEMAEKLDARTQKSLFKDYYQKARTYIEYYRHLMPEEKKKWAPLLYRVYLNLNLGKQFDEIDRILQENR